MGVACGSTSGVTAVRNGSFGWLSSTLTAIAGGHKQSDIDALLPWNYKGAEGGHGHEHHRIEGHA
jgi:hypothetical protein